MRCVSLVRCADWILRVDGDEFKVRCKYCDRMLTARYKQLFQHSVSSKHLSSAASATTVSFPVDVDGCKAPDTSVHLSQDDEMVTDAESDAADLRSSKQRKVGSYICDL